MDAAPIDMVEAGYDAMADRYLDQVGRTVGDPRIRFLDDLQGRLSDGSAVVDLGCGAGVPCTQALAERHSVVGVDVSSAQLRLAAEYVPAAEFRKVDFTDLDLPAASLDAVTAFYSMTHVSRVDHAGLFQRIAGWLKPGGYFLLTLSARGETDGVQEGFIGVPMYVSSYGPPTNREMLQAAGFEVIVDEIVTMQEPDVQSSFQWLLVCRP
jgi:cyclopropane fatty-acyl-phospholipid synthase-like methyltransferase